MTAIEISDIRKMMSRLLIKEDFDPLLVSEITISTGNTYTISGAVNRAFYTREELEAMGDTRYAPWKTFRSVCYELMKGNKTPSYFKIVFLLPTPQVEQLLAAHHLTYQPADVRGLFLNFHYQDNRLTCVTGTSLAFFTLDKTLEEAFDSFVSTLLC